MVCTTPLGLGLLLILASKNQGNEPRATSCTPSTTTVFSSGTASNLGTHEEAMATDRESGQATDKNAKRERSPQRSPNQDRQKRQKSFMNMTLEEDIAADVAETGIDFDFLEKKDDNAPVTMNLSETAPQGSKLTDVPVKRIVFGGCS